MNGEIKKIINVANGLQRTGGKSGASTSERIAAAFVLNRMDYLPRDYEDVVEAWERLGDWQGYVKLVKRDYRYLLEGQ